jgi:AbrB family looped-hinge helix DNA binding protein
MRVNKDGRVTIPKELRDRYDLTPGTDVEVGIEGQFVTFGRTQSVPDRTPAIRKRTGLSTEEIMKLLRHED